MHKIIISLLFENIPRGIKGVQRKLSFSKYGIVYLNLSTLDA